MAKGIGLVITDTLGIMSIIPCHSDPKDGKGKAQMSLSLLRMVKDALASGTSSMLCLFVWIYSLVRKMLSVSRGCRQTHH